MKKAFPVLPLFFLLLIPLSSQERGKAFYPTEISARPSDREIILTWKDSQSLSGEIYHIYRHRAPVSISNWEEASLIGTVREGQEEFRDAPPADKSWYYLVTAEDNLYHYPIVIPYGNATVQAVSLREADVSRADAVKISALAVRSDGRELLITFSRDRGDRPVSLYRSTSPITSAARLRDSLLLAVLEGDQHSWRDNPVPGIPYYYAAVDRELLSFGSDGDLFYEGNHSREPAELPLSLFLNNPRMALPVRKAPLPTLQLEKYYSDLPSLSLAFPPEQPLNQVLRRRLDALFSPGDGETDQAPSPQVLIDEKTEDPSVLEDKLRKILGEYFLKDRWSHAERALLILLGEVEDGELKDRIHFYRGQCFYYQGEYEPAYLEFLLSRDSYYRPAVKWMEESLNQLL